MDNIQQIRGNAAYKCTFPLVAPPRGERGLKYEADSRASNVDRGRSPSWGAWIEMFIGYKKAADKIVVAPPRGERGLKFLP